MEQNLEPRALQKLLIYDKFVNTDFAQDCVMDAFNEGRQSVIDNIPDLVWPSGRAETIIGTIELTHCLNYYSFRIGEMRFWKNYDCVEDAMKAANDYYKNRIKKSIRIMNKDKELELKVQMFCAAAGNNGIDSFYRMESLADNINSVFEIMKNPQRLKNT